MSFFIYLILRCYRKRFIWDLIFDTGVVTMIRNIIWDFDGTLFDTYPAFAKSFRKAVNDLGGDAPLEWITQAAKSSMDSCVSALAERCQLKPEDIEEKFAIHYAQITPEDQPPFYGVIEICKEIYAIGGKNLIVTHRHSSGMIKLLTSHKMIEYFSSWITADDDYAKKPDPAAFDAAIRLHQLNREETLGVGDREIDIQAGKSAGIFTCLFGDERCETEPTLKIKSFAELLVWLRKQN